MNQEDLELIMAEFESGHGMQCNHCGELVYPDGDLLEQHLDNCKPYQELQKKRTWK